MDIITSHNALDFDGLAAMVAASKLYPSATMVFSGTLSRNVKKFMALYKDLITIKTPKEVNLRKVERMIVVDTASKNRLGHLKDTASRTDLRFCIYDHHPASPDDLAGEVAEVHTLGAATTILVEEIMAQNISISPFDASILALGIYEDTGSLLFSSTTPRDIRAAAFLLEMGANLAVVANFMEQAFSGEQRELLQELLGNIRRLYIKNMNIVISSVESHDFTPGLDAVTYRLLEVENCEAVFVVALMQKKINVVGRGRSNNININEVLKSLGGRGHTKAASAIVKNKSVEEVIQILTTELEDKASPGLLARDIMSSPVKTISGDISMEEAGKIMLRYGHTGMPVVDGDQMVGVISRRDVGKARTHDLAHAPVKGFMTSGVFAVNPNTTVSEIQKLMVEYDIGRLPVVEDGRLCGIVSRTDILRTLHGDDYPEDHEVLYSGGSVGQQNCLELMQDRLPQRILSILRLAGEVAETLNARVYCVGGFVRDLFLHEPDFDVDLVVEGDGITLAESLAQKLGGKIKPHPQFKTAVVLLPDGMKIDVATARTEYYEFPAALPTVEKASIKEDMYRRDFTINTLAFCLNPDCFGDLIDYFGGRRDLEKGIIRILYNLSFVEDPTRILRAIRFEQRYKFTIEEDTLRFARDAIERKLVEKLSYDRIMREIVLILNEKDPIPSLERMKEIGVWNYIFPEVDLNTLDWTQVRRVPMVTGWWQERYHVESINSWLIYLMLFASQLDKQKAVQTVQRFFSSGKVTRVVEESYQAPQLAAYFTIHPTLASSEIDQLVGTWSRESILYLLLCMTDETAWNHFVEYLDLKDQVKLEANGNDLKAMGLEPGPIYTQMLTELYKFKLDGKIKNREEELYLLKQWFKEEKFCHH